MAGQILGDGYREALIFLGTAGIVVPLFRRFKISPIIGFMSAGILLGPLGLGRFADQFVLVRAISFSNVEAIAHFAELGVAFLLFMIGLELSFERLRRMRRLVFGLGALQVGVCALVIAGWARGTGLSIQQAAILGGALALSSTAMVIPTLIERKKLSSPAGRATFAILLFQDLMVAPLLFMVSMLDRRLDTGGGVSSIASIAVAILPGFLAMVAIVGLGRLVLRPIFQQVAMTRSTELFMAACLFVVIGTGVATASAGLSMALGAFIAGLLLAETEYRREVEVTIEPFRGLLLGLFFVSTGAALDVTRIIADPLGTLGLAAEIIGLKAVLIYTVARIMRLPDAVSRDVALNLGPGGEFAFVLIGAAVSIGALDTGLAAQVMLAVTLSMLAIPLLMSLSKRLVPVSLAAEAAPEPDPPGESNDHVIVAGYGRVGNLVGEMLDRHKIPFIAIDGDAALVARARKEGQPIYFGDATRTDFLQKCGIAKARALVVTMDAPAAADLIVSHARGERPDMTIVARARDAHHAGRLYELGASDAVPETVEASLQLSEAVLVDIGIPMGLVIASIHEKRDEYRRLFQPLGGENREKRAIRLSTRMRDLSRKGKP